MFSIQQNLAVQVNGRLAEAGNHGLQYRALRAELASRIGNKSFVCVDCGGHREPGEGEEMLKMAVLLY